MMIILASCEEIHLAQKMILCAETASAHNFHLA